MRDRKYLKLTQDQIRRLGSLDEPPSQHDAEAWRAVRQLSYNAIPGLYHKDGKQWRLDGPPHGWNPCDDQLPGMCVRLEGDGIVGWIVAVHESPDASGREGYRVTWRWYGDFDIQTEALTSFLLILDIVPGVAHGRKAPVRIRRWW